MNLRHFGNNNCFNPMLWNESSFHYSFKSLTFPCILSTSALFFLKTLNKHRPRIKYSAREQRNTFWRIGRTFPVQRHKREIMTQPRSKINPKYYEPPTTCSKSATHFAINKSVFRPSALSERLNSIMPMRGGSVETLGESSNYLPVATSQ